MNVDVLLHKLHPLLPRQVDHWRAVRPLVDDTTRELLEREVAATARRAPGDYWNQILLSLPPPKALAGRFQLDMIHYMQGKRQSRHCRNHDPG